MARVLMKGNEAVAEAALRAGADAYYGYPITPQSEIAEYMSREMPLRGRSFLQTESEVATINMVWGAGAAGARVITSSSGPGISLMQEGISYMCAGRVPGVIVDMMRLGPGPGNLQGAQDDYITCVKGGGNGTYKVICLAPATLQEAIQLVSDAFDLADKYTNPVIFLADGMIGQMMEAVDFDLLKTNPPPEKPWALRGRHGGPKKVISAMARGHVNYYAANWENEQSRYPAMEKEVRYEASNLEDAELVFVAYGSSARMAKYAAGKLRGEGVRVGLIRPITLWPFPHAAFDQIGPRCKAVIVPELTIIGQMIEDVQISAAGRWPVFHVGNQQTRPMNPSDVVKAAHEVLGGAK